MGIFETFSESKESKEIDEFIESFFKLQAQINNPTRDGMVAALSTAQNVARQEITMIEKNQGDIYQMPWSSFQYNDLYRKLSQYQQGLYIHAVNKFGEEVIKQLIKERIKANQNQ